MSYMISQYDIITKRYLDELRIKYNSNVNDINYYTNVYPVLGNTFIFVLKRENQYLKQKIQKLMRRY